jgi:predicted dehydrogenase
MKPKTIGVIGLGSIGLRHKTNLWKHLGQTEVVGYDPDPAKQSGTGWVIGDLNKMIEMCDAFVIASPTSEHLQHIVLCRGKPTFVEKPITSGETKTVFFNSVLMVGYNLRMHPCVITAKQWLDQGYIGKPLWANFVLGQHSAKPPYLRDGVIFNWSHEIDLALHLLGRGSVAGSSTRLSDGRDDLTDIMFTHENGCRSTIHLDYLSKPQIRQTIIAGKKGQIIFDLVNHQGWLRDKDGNLLATSIASGGWDDTYIDEMKAFIDRMDGKETLGCSAEEGLEVLKVCLEVRKQAGL